MIVIKNGCIWSGKEFLFGDVAIEDGKIAQIGTIHTTVSDYVFDASDAIISAGLVDIHTHLRNVSCDKFGVQGESRRTGCIPI